MYCNSPTRRQIERLRHRRRLLAAEDDFFSPTRTGLQKLQRQITTDAAASKRRNVQLLQLLQAASDTQLKSNVLVAQLCALRGAYLTMLDRTFEEWYATAAPYVQQHQAVVHAAGTSVHQQINDSGTARTAEGDSTCGRQQVHAVRNTGSSQNMHMTQLNTYDSLKQQGGSNCATANAQELQCLTLQTLPGVRAAATTGSQTCGNPAKLPHAAVEQLVSSMSEQLALLQQLSQQQLQQPTLQRQVPQSEPNHVQRAQQQIAHPQQEGESQEQKATPALPVQPCLKGSAVCTAPEQAPLALPLSSPRSCSAQQQAAAEGNPLGTHHTTDATECSNEPQQQQQQGQQTPISQPEFGACWRRVAELEQQQQHHLQQQHRKYHVDQLKNSRNTASHMQQAAGSLQDQQCMGPNPADQVFTSNRGLAASATEQLVTVSSTLLTAVQQGGVAEPQCEQPAAADVMRVHTQLPTSQDKYAADQPQHVTGASANSNEAIQHTPDAMVPLAAHMHCKTSAATGQDAAAAVHNSTINASTAIVALDFCIAAREDRPPLSGSELLTAEEGDPAHEVLQGTTLNDVPSGSPGPVANSAYVGDLSPRADTREDHDAKSLTVTAPLDPAACTMADPPATSSASTAEMAFDQAAAVGSCAVQQPADRVSGATLHLAESVHAATVATGVTATTKAASAAEKATELTGITAAPLVKGLAKAPPPAPPMLLAALASSKYSRQQQSITTGDLAASRGRSSSESCTAKHVGSTVAAAIAQLQQNSKAHPATPQTAAQAPFILPSSTAAGRSVTHQKLGISSSSIGLGAAGPAAAGHCTPGRCSTDPRDLDTRSRSLHNPDSLQATSASTDISAANNSARQGGSTQQMVMSNAGLRRKSSTCSSQPSSSNPVLFSPATRLSLGAVGNDASGRPSLSSESETSSRHIGGQGRWSLGGASVSGGEVVHHHHPALQPPLRVPEAVVPGTRRTSTGDSLPERSSRQPEQQQQQQQVVDSGFSPLSMGVKRLGSGSLSVSKLVAQYQQQSGAGGEAAQAAEELPQQQQNSRQPQLQPTQQFCSIPQHQQQQLRKQQSQTANPGTPCCEAQMPMTCADRHNNSKAVNNSGRLVSKVLNTGLTDFDDSQSDDGDCKDAWVVVSASGRANASQPVGRSSAAGLVVKALASSPAPSPGNLQHNSSPLTAAISKQADRQRSMGTDDFDF